MQAWFKSGDPVQPLPGVTCAPEGYHTRANAQLPAGYRFTAKSVVPLSPNPEGYDTL